MSDEREPRFPSSATPDSGDDIGRLLRLAGPREAVPVERMARMKTAVRAEWRQQTHARSRRIAIGWSVGMFAAAALILIGVRLAVRDDPAMQSPQRELATIEAVSGAVRLVSSSGRAADPTLFQTGDRMREGDGVDTTSGGSVRLRLVSGASVRIDRGTRFRLISDSTLALDEGTVYVDSGGRRAGSIEVRTAVGIARDIGTRFEVRFNDSALRVRVRDGQVRLSQSRQSHDAHPGDELTLDGNGSVVRRTVPIYGTDWRWVETLAPPFDLEGRSLRDFLNWITSENGWQLRFADSVVEQKSQTTTLHGSITGLTPEEALVAVLPTSGVEHRLENGVLLILGDGGTKN